MVIVPHGIFWIINPMTSLLTLFRRGGQKAPPYEFSPVTSTK